MRQAFVARAARQKIPLCYLDLRGSGLSILERLCLEEVLWNHDDRHWMIAGTHEANNHKYLRSADLIQKARITSNHNGSGQNIHDGNRHNSECEWHPDQIQNDSAVIVMGIGGKPEQLLNLQAVRQEPVQIIKRFSGGGTVVLDADSIWTTIIGRRQELVAEHFPRPIMEWSAEAVFGPVFEKMDEKQTQKHRPGKRTMVLDSKSCAVENSGRVVVLEIPKRDSPDNLLPPSSFRLRENDYVLGERKMGGNAQSIGKNGFLHHTSFLWDYDAENMEYLTLPSKRPQYRGERSHRDFLVKLSEAYPALAKSDFYSALSETCRQNFTLQPFTLPQVMNIVNTNGGLRHWFLQKSRNKLVTDVENLFPGDVNKRGRKYHCTQIFRLNYNCIVFSPACEALVANTNFS
jgi:lipoate-protein ligase A